MLLKRMITSDRVVLLWWSIHLGQDFLREGLRDLINDRSLSGGLATLLNCLSHGSNVSIERVDDDRNRLVGSVPVHTLVHSTAVIVAGLLALLTDGSYTRCRNSRLRWQGRLVLVII